MRRGRVDLERVNRAVDALELPDAIWKTCPWQPRELVATGLRQWLRCCGAALRDDQVIGMPSHAVDEAYARFLHHHPEGGAPAGADHGAMAEQLRRTVVAWSLVARPGERCVLWDLDARVGVDQPWGVPDEVVRAVESAVTTQ